MSNVRSLSVSTMTDSKILTRALKSLGYKPVAAPNQSIRGDAQFDTRHGFDIVLKKEDTKLRADIGFKRVPKKGFEITLDQYVVREFTLDQFVERVEGEYLVTKAKMNAEAAGGELLQPAKEVTIDGVTYTQLVYTSR